MTLPRQPVSSRLPDFPWDQLVAFKERAQAHPGGIVDLSVGTPVDPVAEPIRRALYEGSAFPGYPTTAGTPSPTAWPSRPRGATTTSSTARSPR